MLFTQEQSVPILKPKSLDEAILVWIRKPHVVNRRLCGASILVEIETSGNEEKYFLKNPTNLSSKVNIELLKQEALTALKSELILKELSVELRENMCSKLVKALEYIEKDELLGRVWFFVRRLVFKGNVAPRCELILKSLFCFRKLIKQIVFFSFQHNQISIHISASSLTMFLSPNSSQDYLFLFNAADRM